MLVTNYIQTDFDKELLKRDDNGCVECPSSAGSCPTCPSGEQCQLSSRTCNSCSKYYCATIVSKKTTPIGGIVGGVIGGLAFIALIVGIAHYILIFKKRKIEYFDEEDDEEYWDEEDKNALDLESPVIIASPIGSMVNTSQNTTLNQNPSVVSPSPGVNGITDGTSPGNGLGVGAVGVAAGAAVGATAAVLGGGSGGGVRTLAPRRPGGTRRVSSYESFTRTTKTKQQKQRQMRMQRQQRQLKILQQQQQQQHQQDQQDQQDQFIQPGNGMLQPSNRTSVATSFSNASNILPIAYIPGVTVVPNPSNTRLIFSSEIDLLYTDSISIVSIDPEIQQSATTTAIRAQARLVDVNVDRIEEEDSEFDTDSDVDSDIGRKSSPFGE